jgi:Domain of unknown function (DUF4124)
MRTSHQALALTLALACVAGAALAQNSDKGAVAYRWVDEHGVVHYGDTIPPQYARNSKQILNGEGVQIGQIDAEKTPEQLAREAHAQARQAQQQQHDYFLLSTYTSVKDIESLRDERLSQIEAQQTAAQQYVQSLHSRLTSLQSRAEQFKPYSSRPGAPRMPDDLAQELVQTLSEVHAQDQAIAARTEQEAQVRAQFQSDIERFAALKSAPP